MVFFVVLLDFEVQFFAALLKELTTKDTLRHGKCGFLVERVIVQINHRDSGFLVASEHHDSHQKGPFLGERKDEDLVTGQIGRITIQIGTMVGSAR